MIKTLQPGPGFNITYYGNSSYPYVNMANPSAGMLRYNGTTLTLEVYDGNTWMTLPSMTTSIDFDNDTKSILEWAKKKRNEEMERDLLAVASPAIKDLLKQIEEKEEQIKVLATLVKPETQHHRV